MHLPYGAFSTPGSDVRLGVRTDDGQVVDLRRLSEAGAVPDPTGTLRRPTLNAFLAEGPERWADVRAALADVVGEADGLPLGDVRLHLPFEVADYVDFYSSLHHAANVGRLFRPDGEPLLPNWRHVPVAYHGRAGTVVVSGTDVARPHGQYLPSPGAERPVFGPSTRLDVEVEVGFVVGVPSPLGVPVAASAFADHVFGLVLVNDWSARDIQAWEYQPLGPFLGKSFATSVSAWVTPLEALAAARVPPPEQDPPPLPYLRDDDPWSLDLRLELVVNGTVLTRPPFAHTYWTPGQQLAHMTVNGASLRTGDLYASGTVSGPGADEVGSLLELGSHGFLEDGDEVTIRGTAPAAGGGTLSLGDVRGRVLPACPMSL
ncbi:MAG TPA: fumarylacetoacetate hydrolase family protein [Acidimicrobiales bacterium]|nr:fumarylacetoacetate hydrolase family protein [Acidimicrobiales bacterium]